MNKKHKQRKQEQNFPWTFLVLGAIFLAVAAFLLARQSGSDGGGTPAIAVDQQRIDYGDVKLGVSKTFAIKVTNTGDGSLRFKEDPYIEVVEGC